MPLKGSLCCSLVENPEGAFSDCALWIRHLSLQYLLMECSREIQLLALFPGLKIYDRAKVTHFLIAIRL